MIKKLHKMEKIKGTEKAYRAIYDDTYMFILYCKGLVEMIELEYGEKDEYILSFKKKCEKFMNYLLCFSKSKSKIDKNYLASFLKSYTKFFNKIIEKNYPFLVNQELVEKWNMDCLMAYIATWGI